MATSPVQTVQQAFSPLFGRPGWSYTNVQQGPVRGPTPRLSIGTGQTGDPSAGGKNLPGYLSEQEYVASPNGYDPTLKNNFMARLPRSINVGNDGRDLVGTYKPHDYTPADRWIGVIRSAPNWQVNEFPPNTRNLLQWQQVQRYRIQSLTLSARPLDSSQYFLGYQVQTQVAAAIGQTNLGYMGSM